MRILAIDPGPEKSAFVIYAPEKYITDKGIVDNVTILQVLQFGKADILVLEMVESFGMPVGKSVFETCLWIGRFIQAWMPQEYCLLYRSQVKLHLCNSRQAKDSNIRQAILDRFPLIGGGKTPQIGNKSKLGLLYGVKKDMWSALALAITWCEMQNKKVGDAFYQTGGAGHIKKE